MEGFHAVKHALRFGATLDVLVGTNGAKLDELAEILAPELHAHLAAELEIVPPKVFSALAPQAPQTGVIGIAQRPEIDVAEVLFNPTPRPIVLLEDPRNLQNMGACVRVAAAGDAAGVLTTGMHDPWHPDAIRAAAGLHFALPIGRVDQMCFGDRPVIAVDPNGERFRPGNMPPRAVLTLEPNGTESQTICTRAPTIASLSQCVPESRA